MKQHGPWQIKESTVVYENPWQKVREDAVVRPDGKDGIFSVLEMAPGVSVLAIEDDGTVYLTKEFRYAIGRDSVEVVSGAVDAGESPLEAGKRELQEEAGLEADEWIDLGSCDPYTSAINSPTQLYIARGLHEVPRALEPTEIIEIQKASLKEAAEMVIRGDIVHGSSSILILKAYLRTL